MPKYIICSTWNGEGYHISNTAELLDLKSDDDAQLYIIEKLYDLELTDDWTIEYKRGNICYYNDGDRGSFQWFNVDNTNVYGVVIRCNLNDVKLVDKKEYDSNFESAWNQRDSDDDFEYEPNEGIGERMFIGAHHQDYDYQFIKFN